MYRDELGICLGETRVDVVAVNGALSGWEIKSDRDKLVRLGRQVELYGRVLDAAVIVTGAKFASAAVEVVPDWWGVWRCVPAGRWPRIEVVRAAGVNPAVDRFSLAQLLWRDEAYTELAARGLADGLRSATRWRLWTALAEQLSQDELGRAVRDRLRARRGW
jgi:hypothetical protein